MDERRQRLRGRTFLGGKIWTNRRHSVISCTVRNLSDTGCCLQVESVVGIPPVFDLQIDGEPDSRACALVWQSNNRIGAAFRDVSVGTRPVDVVKSAPAADSVTPAREPGFEDHSRVDLLRGELLRLRAAIDQVPFGVVLLDADMKAQFINQAFRSMWRLPDAKADGHPPFVALMYHGRDTHAYEVPDDELDDYVAARVEFVKSGDPAPRDLRLTSGDVLRFQCTVLPHGGRMLTYNYVTDIVRHADELEMFNAALDNVAQGVMLLDARFCVQFMNRAARKLWQVPDEQAERKPRYEELVRDSRRTGSYGVPRDQLDAFISARIAAVRAGDPTPKDLPISDGRIIRSQCTALPGGGRMLTYTDVTDLVRGGQPKVMQSPRLAPEQA